MTSSFPLFSEKLGAEAEGERGRLVAVERFAADPEAFFVVVGLQVQAAELAFACPPDDGGIAVFRDDRAGLAAGAIAERLAIAERQAGDDDGGVVLLRAVDAVGKLVVERDLVDFGGRLV